MISAITQRATHKVIAPEPWEATLSVEQAEGIDHATARGSLFCPVSLHNK